MNPGDVDMKFERIFEKILVLAGKGLFGGTAQKKMRAMKENARKIFHEEFDDAQ